MKHKKAANGNKGHLHSIHSIVTHLCQLLYSFARGTRRIQAVDHHPTATRPFTPDLLVNTGSRFPTIVPVGLPN